MNSKPTLVTGGCGFVGRHLIRTLLARGTTDIWVVDNLSTGTSPRIWLGEGWKETKEEHIIRYRSQGAVISFIEADALSFFHSHAIGCGPVPFPEAFSDAFHLASIVGGRSLIDGDPIMVAADLGIDAMFFYWLTRDPTRVERVLYASSSAAYPTLLQRTEDAESLVETDINFEASLGAPDMTYGWSKLTGEYLAKLAHDRYGVHIACVRPFSGFGEDQDLSYPTPSIALRVARKDDPIDVWGTGKQGRDFIHIDDCIDAFFPILDRVADGSGINIGTGTPTTFLEIIERMLRLENHTANIHPLADKPVGVMTRYANPEKLTGIGWKPKLSLDEGLQKVLTGAHERLNGNPLPFRIP